MKASRKQAKKVEQQPKSAQAAAAPAAQPAAEEEQKQSLRKMGESAITVFGRRCAEMEEEITNAISRFENETALQVGSVKVTSSTTYLGRNGLRGHQAIRQYVIEVALAVPHDVVPAGKTI